MRWAPKLWSAVGIGRIAMSSISIIVPTYNRATSLRKTLGSVAAVVKPSDPVEIIIVDNGSTDKTVEVCKGVDDAFPDRRWMYVYEPMPGLLSGRHRGAKEAQGEILAFLDDDVLLAPGWLEALWEAFADPSVTLVGGPSRPSYEVEPPDWLEELWWSCGEGRMCGALSLIDLGGSVKPINAEFVFGLNFSIRKTVLQGCGGFHPDCIPKTLQRYQGDGETGLSLKINDKALRVMYHPSAAVTHVIPAARLTLEYLQQRAFYQGVCDSYTQIRRDRGVPAQPERSRKDWIRPAKRRIEREMLLRNPNADKVRHLMARAHYDGVQFHQSEVRQDPKLLSWVLREDYFHYSLPDGWEAYLNPGVDRHH
jgi:glucosyl-dolichyl phosphate glucuronosyltransferase